MLARSVRVLTLMTRSVCALPGEALLKAHFHLIPLFLADRTTEITLDKSKQVSTVYDS